jgi:hypothetical protein
VRLVVTVDSERGPIATGIETVETNDGEELRSFSEMAEILRGTIDMSALLRELASDALAYRVWDAASPSTPGHRTQEERDQIVGTTRLARDVGYEVAAPRRRHLLTKKHLDEVAAVYREALKKGEPPTKAVQDRYGIAHSTAAKWVWTARRSHSLGPAHGPLAGERASS